MDKAAFSNLCKADVYAFGILLGAMCCNDTIYSTELLELEHASENGTDFHMDLLQNVRRGERPHLPDISSNIRALIELCWQQNACDRPTFSELIQSLSELLRVPAPTPTTQIWEQTSTMSS